MEVFRFEDGSFLLRYRLKFWGFRIGKICANKEELIEFVGTLIQNTEFKAYSFWDT